MLLGRNKKYIYNIYEININQPSAFRTNNWVEINDDTHGNYSTNSQITFKTTILKSISCDYSDAQILVKGTITMTNVGTTAASNNREKK